MKRNKGIIGIGLILAIALGLVVVGGGAYYFREINSQKEINNPEVNQKLPAVNNQQTNCNSNSTPSITVVSPNGGEVFTVGQQIAVKWTSCNIAEDAQVFIQLAQGLSQTETNDGIGGIEGIPYYSLNNGSKNIDLQLSMFNNVDGFSYGKNFRIQLTLTSNDKVFDYSDNSFTINSEKTISTTLPKYYVGSHSNCDGLSPCWPPIISNSNASYSCVLFKNQGDTTYDVVQKNINGRNYCVQRSGDSFAGGIGWKYTYTTANGDGTKTTTFGLTYQSCGVYGRSGEPQYDECKNVQSNFSMNLDNLIDSLMQTN